jgi:hypothetical protein
VFRGTVRILQRNTKAYWFGGGATAVTVLVFVVGELVPGHQSKIVIHLLLIPMVPVYLLLVAWVLKPTFALAEVYVDQTGLYRDGAPVVRREEIARAYIRNAIAARRIFVPNAGSFTAPDYPMTIDIIKRGRGQLHIDAGSEPAAAAILMALGFPVTFSDYNPRGRKVSMAWILSGYLIAAMFFVWMFLHVALRSHSPYGP